MELKLEGIKKSYTKGRTYAIQDFSYCFTPGVYGLLGPNGAGKSTLMNMITQNLSPDGGRITLDGTDIGKLGASYRNLLGYMPQQQGLYDDFTGEKFLWYIAALKGLKRREAQGVIKQSLEVVNLWQDRFKKLRSYSGGMKQRVLIAQALLNDPKILIMDEPTRGVDIGAKKEIYSILSNLTALGIAVIVISSELNEVMSLCDRVLVLRKGMLVDEIKAEEMNKERLLSASMGGGEK